MNTTLAVCVGWRIESDEENKEPAWFVYCAPAFSMQYTESRFVLEAESHPAINHWINTIIVLSPEIG